MADRRIRYTWVWMLFLASMVAGAAFLTSSDPDRVRLGLILLLTPLLLTGLALAIFYALTRWRAMTGQD